MTRPLRTLVVLLVASFVALCGEGQGADASPDAGDKPNVKTLIEHAAKLHQLGNTAGALDTYNEAAALDPINTQILYARSAILQGMGRTNPALKDLNRIIEINPAIADTYKRRGQLLLKQANTAGAKADLLEFQKRNAKDESIGALLEDVDKLHMMVGQADELLAQKNWQQASQLLSSAIEIAPHSAKLRTHRADCFKELNDIEQAIAEYKRAASLEPDSVSIIYKVAELHLSLGEIDGAFEQLKNCLRLDPENKQCFQLRKEVKNVKTAVDTGHALKQERKWAQLVSHYEAAINKFYSTPQGAQRYASKKHEALQALCEAHVHLKDPKQALTWCNQAIAVNDKDWESYCNKGEAEILLEDYDSAIRNYQKASELSGQNERATSGLKRADGLKRQANKVDYYKLFGVSRHASKKEIKDAYRKLSREWHPDRYQGDDLEKAQNKMAQLNLAYEVLSDDELRKRYDLGDDPNDAEQQQQNAQHQQQQQQQHFFHQFQGGFPFGGGHGHGHGGGGFHF